MFKTKGFWIVLSLLIILSILFLFKYFPQVMTFINLDISMDRNEALTKATEIAELFDLGPEQYDAAAMFSNDTMTQYYVELEAGGVDAFNNMIKGDLYEPYTWDVRLFYPGESREVNIIFTPEGQPYGFNENLPETLQLNSVSSDSALIIAQTFAVEQWNINLEEYDLVETKDNKTISDRIDHSFVFERPDKIGEARYRLQITVAGDHVSKIINYVKIPEHFLRKYQEMRSANNTIAMVGQIAMVVLYGLGGILIGMFLLLRKRWILWKEALVLAAIIAILGVLANLNYLPLFWNWYDTALSKSSYIFNQIMQFVTSGITDFLLLAVTFIAAESLTRKAFPNHVRFWHIWRKGCGNSYRILGNTIAGYYVAVLSLVFIVTFYYVTTKYFNWWNPASLAVNPNSLATPLPWLPAIANAFHAGFWEEALFRAVPLAGAALIGDRIGKRKLFIGIALIIQALIFGAGHANYAAQPAYARLVELIIPSLYFAFLYLRFGLFTGALMHFVFDAILMSMPIWVSSGSSVWISRILFLILFFLPLFIVLIRRIQTGKWEILSDKFKNKSWNPTVAKVKKITKEVHENINIKPLAIIVVTIIGIFGLILWVRSVPVKDYNDNMKIDKNQAIEIAKETLAVQNIEISDQWKASARIIGNVTLSDKMLWEQLPQDEFDEIYSQIQKTSYWNVRFSLFEGDVAERAEEYRFMINGSGKLIGFQHSLPENRAANSIDKSKATVFALDSLADFFGLDPESISIISASPERLPNRTDWTFILKSEDDISLKTGEIRYLINIKGNKLMGINKFIYVPEDWQREYNNKTRTPQVIVNLFNVFIIILFLFTTVLAIISWSKKHFNTMVFLVMLLLMLIIKIVATINRIPIQIADFSTSQPWSNQYTTAIAVGIFQSIITALFIAITAGWVSIPNKNNLIKFKQVIYSVGWSFLILGMLTLISNLKPVFAPAKTDISQIASVSPILADILTQVSRFMLRAISLLAIARLTSMIWNASKNRKILSFIFFLLIALIYVGKDHLIMFAPEVILFWLFASLLVAVIAYIAFKSLIRFDNSALLIVAFVISVFMEFGIVANNLYSVNFIGFLIGSLLLIPLILFWYRVLHK